MTSFVRLFLREPVSRSQKQELATCWLSAYPERSPVPSGTAGAAENVQTNKPETAGFRFGWSGFSGARDEDLQ